MLCNLEGDEKGVQVAMEIGSRNGSKIEDQATLRCRKETKQLFPASIFLKRIITQINRGI